MSHLTRSIIGKGDDDDGSCGCTTLFIPALTIYTKTLHFTDSDTRVLENSNKQIILKSFKIPQNRDPTQI
jgi:hypothetical protein